MQGLDDMRKKELMKLLKDMETNSVNYKSINMGDGFSLVYSKACDYPGLYLHVHSSKDHSWTNTREITKVESRDVKEILEFVEQAKKRYKGYADFMEKIDFTVKGNGRYEGELKMNGGKKLLTFTVYFRLSKQYVRMYEGTKIKTTPFIPSTPYIQCDTTDFIGFVVFILKTRLPFEEIMKLPSDIRDMISEYDLSQLVF